MTNCGLHCLKINDFSVSFGNRDILKNVNLHAHCGELTTIIGGNGSGKSTLLKAITGEVKHKGTLTFSGHSESDGKEACDLKSAPLLGYVPQHLQRDENSPLSVFDMIFTFHSKYPVFLPRRKKDYEKIQSFLGNFAASHLIDQSLGKLSGGELQRVLLANAMFSSPDILILDEPVSGVDQEGLNLFYSMIKELREKEDIIIILVTHDLDFALNNSDKVLLLNSGRHLFGTPAEVFESDEFKTAFPRIGFGSKL